MLDSDVFELKTSQFKVQVAFKDDFDESKFEGIRITRYRQEGSVANMIVSGDREQTMDIINAMNPVVFDVLPLTLEEVFTYEMEALGYEADKTCGLYNDGGNYTYISCTDYFIIKLY